MLYPVCQLHSITSDPTNNETFDGEWLFIGEKIVTNSDTEWKVVWDRVCSGINCAQGGEVKEWWVAVRTPLDWGDAARNCEAMNGTLFDGFDGSHHLSDQQRMFDKTGGLTWLGYSCLLGTDVYNEGIHSPATHSNKAKRLFPNLWFSLICSQQPDLTFVVRNNHKS